MACLALKRSQALVWSVLERFMVRERHEDLGVCKVF
jgi:hypothetical protein